MAKCSNTSSQLYKIIHYLLSLLRSSHYRLLRLLRHIAHGVLRFRPAHQPKPSIEPRPRPRPLPVSRPRALTPSRSPRTVSEPPPTTSPQLQCPLFYSLPLEIRRLIYRHTFVSGAAHIVRIGTRLGHVRCHERHHVWPRTPHRCWGPGAAASDPCHGPRGQLTEEDRRGLLPLVMACRRIYTEAIPVLYEETTFSILDLESMISLADTILPQRLHAIRTVELGWYFCIPYPLYTRRFQRAAPPPYDVATWERFWAILADMTGLRNLRVDLVGSWIEPLTADEEERLLGPATDVKRPQVWDLRVDWEDAGVDWEAQGAPFKLVRDGRIGKESDAFETSIWA